MKLLQFIFLLITTTALNAQCPEGVIELRHQYQVDLFTEKYPNCENLSGILTIGGSFDSASAYDFSKMPKFKSIGSLIINGNTYANFDFLQDLTTLKSLSIQSNNSLESLDFLESLKTADNIGIYQNNNLKNIDDLNVNTDSLKVLTIRKNAQLDLCNNQLLCDALSNEQISTTIEDNAKGKCPNIFELAKHCGLDFPYAQNQVYNLYDQGDIDSLFIRFPEASEVWGLNIQGGPDSDIVSLEHLKDLDLIYYLNITDCQNLLEISGLDSTVINELYINNCHNIVSLSGLNMAKKVAKLNLTNCDNISSLEDIKFNQIGIQGLLLDELPSLNDDVLDIDDLDNELLLANLNWNNLNALSNVKNVGYFRIQDMPILSSLDGLDNLKTAKELRIFNLPSLIDFSGFNNLKTIQTIYISLDSSKIMKNCFNNLDSITGSIYITSNKVLDTIQGFNNLAYLGNLLLGYNPELVDIDFLNHELVIGNDFTILNNAKLSNCSLLGLCSNLNISNAALKNNSDNCNSLAEISYSCATLQKNPTVDVEITSQDELDAFALIYPNADSILANVNLLNNSQTSPIIDLSYFDQIKYIDGVLNLSYFSDYSAYSKFSEVHFRGLSVAFTDIDTLPFMGNLDSLNSLYLFRCSRLKSIENLMGIIYIEDFIEIRQCDSIVSLRGLDSLKHVNTLALLDCRIGDLAGLENLSDVESIELSNAYGFTTMERLISLVNINELKIKAGDLTTLFPPNKINSLSSLVLDKVRYLVGITGFEKIKQVDYLTLQNTNWIKIDGFDNLEVVSRKLNKSNSGTLQITNTNSSIHFPKLRKVYHLKFNNNGFEEIDMFDNLDTVEYFSLNNNSALKRINMFKESIILNSVSITHNSSLSVCSVPWLCNHLNNDGQSYIQSNAVDCNMLSDVLFKCGRNVRCPSGHISLLNNTDLSRYLPRYGTCRVLPGDLNIDAAEVNTNTIDSLVSLVGYLRISNHNGNVVTPNLNNVKLVEFEAMTRDFQLDYEFDYLKSLTIKETSGLDSLTISIAQIDYLGFSYNNGIRVLNFDHPDAIISAFYANANPGLLKIVGPSTEMELYYMIITGSDDLSALEGFENTKIRDFGYVYIYQNPILDLCNITPLCNLDPTFHDIKIHSNGTFCSNLDTIELVCNGIISNTEEIENMKMDGIIVFPNPTDDILYLRSIHQTGNRFSGVVFNTWGERIMSFRDSNQISLYPFNPGIYFIRLSTGKVFKVIKV